MKTPGAVRYLSLAAKAGRIVAGGDECEKAVARQRRGGLMLVASDAGADAVRRARRLAEAPRVRLYRTTYTKSELASALGRGSPVSLALLTDEGLAAAFTAAAAKAMEQEDTI